MQKWIIIALIAAAIGWGLLTNIGAAQALAEVANHPPRALIRTADGHRIPIATPGTHAAKGEAQGMGGEGILFGYRFTYRLPDGSLTTCTIRFRHLACEGGWGVER